MSSLEDLCLELFNIDALKFGNFITKVGIYTPVYLDLRGIISYPKLMNSLSSIIYNYLSSKENNISYDVICGVPYTALPIASSISVQYNIPMIMRRKDVKTYGTKKLIEGVYKSGDKCIIVEDIVTSGSSILETINDLKSADIIVTDILTIVNREQGGENHLKLNGFKLHSLFTISQVMNILLKHKKIDEETNENVLNYIVNNQVETKVLNDTNNADLRIQTPYESRKLNTKCSISSKLIDIIIKKKSNLCLAVDVTKSNELISLAKLLGAYISILKTHSDAIEDFNIDVQNELIKISKEKEFLIMEDRKLADIGATVGHQFNLISKWADLVTVHSISGPGPLKEIENIIQINGLEKGIFLIAELSCEKNLIDEKYTQETLQLAKTFNNITVGLVCQSKSILKNNPELLQLTPGVHLDNSGDNKGQQYNTPDYVIINKGADIAVIGRGVTQAIDKLSKIKEYQEILWKSYEKRIQNLK